MAFEQLVAEAAIKKEKEKDSRKKGKDKHKDKRHFEEAAEAPDVPPRKNNQE